MSSTKNQTCVVIGGSHAGGQLAESTRKSGWEGSIIVISDEPYLPYHRPPLSKTFLLEDKKPDDILIKPRSLYEKLDITFKLNTVVDKIDRAEKRLVLRDGQSVAYDKLGLTLGARARVVPIPGADKTGVHFLRTIGDIERIRPYVAENKNAVIIGGGYIGLETAAALRKKGMGVTILEMMPRILQRVTAPDVSAFYTRLHQEEGVVIKTEVKVEAIEGGAEVSGVKCGDGSVLPADLVIIGAGVLPNIELAEAAGLKVEPGGGVIVDEFATTSDQDIVAAGDCTWHHNPIYDRWLRLESVPNALDQAKIAGAALCGVKKPYNQLPWFWSEQYDVKLQIAGLSQGFDNVVIRGDIATGRCFAAFYFEQDKLVAVDAVNMPIAFMLGKKLILEGQVLDKEKLADTNVDMKSFLK